MEHQKLLYFTPKPTLSKNVRATRRAIQSTLVKGKTNLVFACLSDPVSYTHLTLPTIYSV